MIDIYSLNEKETDSVRLDASTIKQLYEDTDYKLEDIRKNKLVKPIALDSFPTEINLETSLLTGTLYYQLGNFRTIRCFQPN